MKRLFGIVLTAIIGCSFLFALTSCNDNPSPEQPPEKSLFEYEEIVPMSEEMKTQALTLCYEKYVRDEYPKQTVADLKIDYDLGNRNGNYVFIFSDAREYDNDPINRGREVVKTVPYALRGVEYERKIGYYYDNGRPMRVYHDNTVCGFAEAFNSGILSEDDMEYFLQCYKINAQGLAMQKRMDKELENRLTECALNYYLSSMDPNDDYYDWANTKYSIVISHFYGNYNNKVVVALNMGMESEDNADIVIGDVLFKDMFLYQIFVYDGENIFFLKDSAQMFSKEQLELIAEKYNSHEIPVYNTPYSIY